MDNFYSCIKDLEIYDDHLEWCKGKSFEEVYYTCSNGDLLIQLYQVLNPHEKVKLTLTKGHCASLGMEFLQDLRSISAIFAALAYGKGKLNEVELKGHYDKAFLAWSEFSTHTYQELAEVEAACAAYICCDLTESNEAFSVITSVADAFYASIYYSQGEHNIPKGLRLEAHDKVKIILSESADLCRKYLPIDIWGII